MDGNVGELKVAWGKKVTGQNSKFKIRIKELYLFHMKEYYT